MINLKQAVKGNVTFEYFRDGALWYSTEEGDLFPVPVDDAGSGSFGKVEKGMLLMRWMRKWNDSNDTSNNSKYEESITFSRYVDNSGTTVYGCRGIGAIYNDLYNKWLPNTSYKCVRDDFPWDYFIFENPKDEEKFIEEYWNNYTHWELD